MTVYVDNAQIPYKRMKMCHMIADSDDELHRMAETIGISRRHHQKKGTAYSHYDICLQKRILAIAAGAIEVSSREIVTIIRRRKSI